MTKPTPKREAPCELQCFRCRGRLIQDQVVRLAPTVQVDLWRCLNCGDLVDATVLENRRNPDRHDRHYPHRRALVSQPQFIEGFHSGGVRVVPSKGPIP